MKTIKGENFEKDQLLHNLGTWGNIDRHKATNDSEWIVMKTYSILEQG